MADMLKIAQLLLVQPSDTAVLAFRLACVAAGTAAPAWAAYKASQPDADLKTKDRALRLAVAAAAVELGEKLLGGPSGVARWRYWPSAKLALLLWLLLENGRGADRVHALVCRALRPYEAEIDGVVTATSPLLAHAAHSYLSPIKAAAASCVAVGVAGYRLLRARAERAREREREEQRRAAAEQWGRGGGGDERPWAPQPQGPSPPRPQPRWPPAAGGPVLGGGSPGGAGGAAGTDARDSAGWD